MKNSCSGVRGSCKPLFAPLLIFLVILATSAWGQGAFEQAGRGPIRIRNQFPLSLPFLEFAADDNWMLKKRELRLDFHYAHSNTFVKSSGIVRNIQPRNGRGVLTREVAERLVQEQPEEEAFLFDTEVERWSLNVFYGLSDAVMIEAELPILRFGGGFLDPVIENFHNTFGFPDDSRPDFRKNISEAFLYINRQFLYFGPEDLDGAGLGDLVLSSKFRLLRGGKSWPAITARAVIKLPTGDPQKLRGSGSMDYGLDLIVSKPFTKSCLHLNLGAVAPGKWELMPNLYPSPIYSALLSYERLVGKNTSLILQNLASSNVLTGVTDSGIGKISHEITIGLEIDHPPWLRWTFSLTENYAQYNNSPDIGFHVGVMYLLSQND
jgi:hypothetical protein